MHLMAFRFGELLLSGHAGFAEEMPRPMLLLSPAVSFSVHAFSFGLPFMRGSRHMEDDHSSGRDVSRPLSCCPVLQQPLQLHIPHSFPPHTSCNIWLPRTRQQDSISMSVMFELWNLTAATPLAPVLMQNIQLRSLRLPLDKANRRRTCTNSRAGPGPANRARVAAETVTCHLLAQSASRPRLGPFGRVYAPGFEVTFF
jgi:hypothetical protein